MIKDISNRLLRDFAACLQQRLAAEPAGAMSGEEAAASAGAGTTPPDDVAVAEGKSPEEVSGKSPAELSGKSPAEVSGATPPGTVATPPHPEDFVLGHKQATPPPTQAGPAQPPVAAQPVKGFTLLFSVLWERIRNLFKRRS
jgi:hypothetical protein